MDVELIIAPETEEDLAQAYSWYEERRAGLGEEFLTCVDATIHRICRMPEIHAIVHEDYRRTLVRRFPYVVFYSFRDEKVTIYAVLHASRHPDTWRNRLH